MAGREKLLKQLQQKALEKLNDKPSVDAASIPSEMVAEPAPTEVVLPPPEAFLAPPQETVVVPEEAPRRKPFLPQAQDMYAQGGEIGRQLSEQLPEPAAVRLPQVLEDAGTGIAQSLASVPQIFTGPPAAAVPVVAGPAQPLDLPKLAQVVPQVAAPPSLLTEPAKPSLLVPVAQPAVTEAIPRPALPPPTEQEVDAEKGKLDLLDRNAKIQTAAIDRIRQQQEEEAQRQQEIKNAAADKANEIETEVRAKSLPEIMQTGSFGQKLGVALAVMIGGIGQGLMGSKENPVLNMIDNMVSQQAQKDKLAEDKKIALKKLLLEEADQKIRQQQANTQDQYRREQMEIGRTNIALEISKMRSAQEASAVARELQAGLHSGKVLTPEQLASLSEQQQNKVVVLPGLDKRGNLRKVMVNSEQSKKDFDNIQRDTETAVSLIDKLLKISNDPTAWANFWKRAEADEYRQILRGVLRTPFGFGVLQKYEQEQLERAIGNPTALFALSSVEKTKLNKMKEHMYSQLQHSARVAGINERVVPVILRKATDKTGQTIAVPEEELLRQARALNPRLPEDQIRKALDRDYPQL